MYSPFDQTLILANPLRVLPVQHFSLNLLPRIANGRTKVDGDPDLLRRRRTGKPDTFVSEVERVLLSLMQRRNAVAQGDQPSVLMPERCFTCCWRSALIRAISPPTGIHGATEENPPKGASRQGGGARTRTIPRMFNSQRQRLLWAAACGKGGAVMGFSLNIKKLLCRLRTVVGHPETLLPGR